MTEIKVFEKLKEAYNNSTKKDNEFANTLSSIKWDSEFYADDEYNFILGDMQFVASSLNPFNMWRKPYAIFNDGSSVSF